MNRQAVRAIAAGALAAAVVVANPSPAAAATLTMRGADVSSLQRSLDLGAKYYDAGGTAADPLDILKAAGVNYARLRVWNNPASGYNNKAKVLAVRQARQGQGPGADGRLPLLRHLGRPGQAVQAGGLGEPRHQPAARRTSTTTPTTSATPQGAGHHAGQRPDRQRDQRRHAVERRQGRQQQLHQPRRAAQVRLQRGQGVQLAAPRSSSTPPTRTASTTPAGSTTASEPRA